MSTKASVDNPFSCPHCGTLEPRFASRAGLPVSCPGCGRQFVAGVPSLATPNVLAAGSESADESDTYELEPPVARPPAPVFTDEELAPPEPRKPAATREVSLEPVGYDSHAVREQRLHRFHHEPDEPPKVVFLSGVFDFPLRSGVWRRWLSMSFSLLVLGQIGIPCLRLLGVLDDSAASGAMILGLVMGLPTLLITLIGGGYVSACLLAVVEDTANGCDQVQEWPESDWRDWAFTLRLPLMAALGSFAAGSLFSWLAGQWNLAADLAALVVFPVLILSMLESGAALAPISAAILSTCLRFWWVWAIFYAETGLALIAVAWLLRWIAGQSLSVCLCGAPPLVYFMLVYARLLGRLAWYTGWDEQEESDDDEELSAGDLPA